MNKQNFYVGMGMGIMAVSAAAMLMRPKKKNCMKSTVGKALHNMGEIADSVCSSMSW